MEDIFNLEGMAKEENHARILKFMEVILKAAQDGQPFYTDDLDFDHLLCGREGRNSPNLIGIAVRILLQKKAMHKTGEHRRSTRPESRGRTIFQYQIGGR
jgi:hypothetical protein